MSQQLVRDTYQANGLIKCLGHSQFGSSQTSLQKMPAPSPQLLYQQGAAGPIATSNRQQQAMQFHQQLNMQQQPTGAQFAAHPKANNKSDLSMAGPLLVAQQQQQSQMNSAAYNHSMQAQQHQPQAVNGISSSNNLVQPMVMPAQLMSAVKDTQMDPQFAQQQQQQQQASQPNMNLSSQAPHAYQVQQHNPMPAASGQQHQQYLRQTLQQHQHQHGPSQSNVLDSRQQQQPVPITTVMIPASAAAQIQNASMQIQQAALQASANNPQLQTPQIFVFMIPYLAANGGFSQLQPQQQQLPPTLSTTPEEGTSLNSTLVRAAHHTASSTSLARHSQQQQQQQQQASTQMNQQQQQTTASSASHSRAVSSLSMANGPGKVEKFYIKANFSYQATRNRQELSFQKGDILHVLDTLQNNKDYGVQYWLATRVKPNGEDAEKGLIPNKGRAEALALDQRALSVGEPNGTLDGSGGGGGGVLSASVGRVNFLKRRSAQRSKSLCKDNWDNVVFDIGSFKLPTYERVVSKHPGFCRPVVVFGPLSDIARDKLLRDYPEKYSYPSGMGQPAAPDHPKVIRLKGVLDVIDQGKHALLDITAPAVEKLNFVNLAPIVIFMKSDSKSIIKEFRARAAKSLDPNACDEDTLRRDGKSSRKLLEQSVKLEKQWAHVFTAVLDLSTMGSEMWYRKLRETIESQQSANVWMGDKKSDKKLASLAANGNGVAVSSSSLSATSQANNERPPMSATGLTTGQAANGTLHQQQQQLSAGCLPADSSSMLSERFNDCLNISGTRSTTDLVPILPTASEVIYGNRSQMRNAYAHSLAQRLARASSEPKLNGLPSDNELGDDETRTAGHRNHYEHRHDEDDDDDDDDGDDDDDDEIIKKPPFPSEYENSSSISSSNGCASYGQCSLTSGIGGSAPASSSNPIYQVHYQMQQQQQQQQLIQQPLVKPPAPPPPPPPSITSGVDTSGATHNGNSSNILLLTNRTALQANQLMQQQQPQECIYSSTSNPLIGSHNNNSFANPSANRPSHFGGDYHPLPSLTPQNGITTEPAFELTSSGQQQQHLQHLQQRLSQHNGLAANQLNAANQHQHQMQVSHQQHQQSLNNTNKLQQHTISSQIQTSNSKNVIDLSRNHEARGSAFQVYSDMNQNNYHYYNLNKI